MFNAWNPYFSMMNSHFFVVNNPLLLLKPPWKKAANNLRRHETPRPEVTLVVGLFKTGAVGQRWRSIFMVVSWNTKWGRNGTGICWEEIWVVLIGDTCGEAMNCWQLPVGIWWDIKWNIQQYVNCPRERWLARANIPKMVQHFWLVNYGELVFIFADESSI